MSGNTGKRVGILLALVLGAAVVRGLLPGMRARGASDGTSGPVASRVSAESRPEVAALAGALQPSRAADRAADLPAEDAPAPAAVGVEEHARRDLARVEAAIRGGVLQKSEYRELVADANALPRQERERVMSALEKAILEGQIRLEGP